MTTSTNSTEINKLHTLLKYVFVIVPIVAGLDKFTNILVQWDTYLAPATLVTVAQAINSVKVDPI
ncbi:MAG: hypothetical protein Q8O62_12280 [Aequorivita sp.]|nr:hypothetical protein [Aequorivita sp.]